MPCAVVDLFCGIGGLTHGLIQSGLKVVAGIDVDDTCRYAYEANNDSVFIAADVGQLPSRTIEKMYPDSITRILVGCAPCQPFSKYTQRYRKEGQKDEKWKLLYAFADKVRDIRPEIVSMENVPELASDKIFHDFVKALSDSGYHITWSIVYCPDYGVPQSRRRLVLLASNIGDIALIAPQYEPETYLTVKKTIGNLPAIEAGQSSNEDPLHCAARLSALNIMRIQQSCPGGSWRDWDEAIQLDCHKKESGNTYPSVYGRMHWDEPAPTITTQFFGYGNGRFGHPEQDRALSIREGAMLQSFPQNYDFLPPGEAISKKALGIHIGNAVPVNLGRAIGTSIIHHLMEVEQYG